MVKHAANDATGIVGRWRSPPIGWRAGEAGPSQFVIELKATGEIKATWVVSKESPGGGGTRSDQGTYRIDGDVLTTQIMARGEPIKFELSRGHLILTLPKEGESPSEVYEFVREGEG